MRNAHQTPSYILGAAHRPGLEVRFDLDHFSVSVSGVEHFLLILFQIRIGEGAISSQQATFIASIDSIFN